MVKDIYGKVKNIFQMILNALSALKFMSLVGAEQRSRGANEQNNVKYDETKIKKKKLKHE